MFVIFIGHSWFIESMTKVTESSVIALIDGLNIENSKRKMAFDNTQTPVSLGVVTGILQIQIT